MKKKLLIPVLLVMASCTNVTERWLNGMANFRELHSPALSLEVMKIKPQPEDTTTLMYTIRLFPAKEWVTGHAAGLNVQLRYGMDSCFSLRSGHAHVNANFIQPVNNGLANCYEYLVSFPVTKAIKAKKVQLVYQDKFIDEKEYRLQLNN